ncbi:hypothetical protein AGMMS49991_09700 [Spirochaetia bacterium]|nr:hypothetical protein AGMMS49991_09700 [Spirochaetia bacterium]
MKRIFRLFAVACCLSALFACTMENRAMDDRPAPISTKWDSGEIILEMTSTESHPVGAFACCYARTASAFTGDTGPFNSYGDNNPPSKVYDGTLNSWWQANYSGSGENHGAGWDNRHWMTVDLGSSTEIDTLKMHNEKANTTNYRIYASDDPDDLRGVPNPAKFVKAGTLDAANGTYSIIFDNRVTARYVQFRCTAESANTDRTIGEMWCEFTDITKVIGFDGVNATPLYTAYAWGDVLLKNLDKTNIRYDILKNALDNALTFLKDFESTPISDFVPAQIALQQNIDAQLAKLYAVMDSIDPPRKPPED